MKLFLIPLFATGFALQVAEPEPIDSFYDVPTAPGVELDVPYVPTPQEVVDVMLDLAEIRDGDTVYDLGCGDGRIVISAAKRAAIRGIGIDLDPERIDESRANAAEAGVGHKVEFRVGDLFETDFADATVLAMYLLPSVNHRLRPVILETLRPGTRVVSHAFDFRDWAPDQKVSLETFQSSDIYFWIVPANSSGKWEFAVNGKSIAVEFAQEFQLVEGSSPAGELVNVSLAGADLRFDLPTENGFFRVEGRLEGDHFTGTAANESSGDESVTVTGIRVAGSAKSIIP